MNARLARWPIRRRPCALYFCRAQCGSRFRPFPHDQFKHPHADIAAERCRIRRRRGYSGYARRPYCERRRQVDPCHTIFLIAEQLGVTKTALRESSGNVGHTEPRVRIDFMVESAAA